MEDFDSIIEEVSERLHLRGNPTGTLNKIEINGKKPHKDSLKVAIDQLILLCKSELWGYTMEMLNGIMERYHQLPEEKQVKVLPNKVKYITALGKELKQMSKIVEYRRPKKAMNMNDENDEVQWAHNYGDVKVDDIVINDIIEDLDLDEPKYVEPQDDDMDIIIKSIGDELFNQPEVSPHKEAMYRGEIWDTSTPREIFDDLKAGYPKDRSVSQLEWETSKGTITHIFDDYDEWEDKRKQLRLDSTINYNSSKHYCKDGDFNFYIIRYK